MITEAHNTGGLANNSTAPHSFWRRLKTTSARFSRGIDMKKTSQTAAAAAAAEQIEHKLPCWRPDAASNLDTAERLGRLVSQTGCSRSTAVTCAPLCAAPPKLLLPKICGWLVVPVAGESAPTQSQITQQNQPVMLPHRKWLSMQEATLLC